jgi:hypothetical protein
MDEEHCARLEFAKIVSRLASVGFVEDDRLTSLHVFHIQKTTEEIGPDVRRLGAMAGTVKLEVSSGRPLQISISTDSALTLPTTPSPLPSQLELGWFVEERYRGTTFREINPRHPLFDARPVALADTATHAGLTHTSKFGRIFKKPFSLPPAVGSRGMSRKFMANPPPFRNGVPGGSAKRPFAEFFWIIGVPGQSVSFLNGTVGT